MEIRLRSLTEGDDMMVRGYIDDVRPEGVIQTPSFTPQADELVGCGGVTGQRLHQLSDQTQKVFPPCGYGHFHLSVRLSPSHPESVEGGGGGCRWTFNGSSWRDFLSSSDKKTSKPDFLETHQSVISSRNRRLYKHFVYPVLFLQFHHKQIAHLVSLVFNGLHRRFRLFAVTRGTSADTFWNITSNFPRGKTKDQNIIYFIIFVVCSLQI